MLHPRSRRDFLTTVGKGLGFVAFATAAPKFLTGSVLAGVSDPGRDAPVLVIIQLAGGNDGLNTLVPFEDDYYYRLRPTLGLKKQSGLIPIAENLAFHAACAPLAELWKNGNLSIVRNVGYPNPNHSHFRSTEIWETATDAHVSGYTGWLGRYFDATCDGRGQTPDPVGFHATGMLPQSFFSDKPHNTFGLEGDARNKSRPPGGHATFADAGEILEALNNCDGHDHDGADNAAYMQHAVMDTLITENRVHAMLTKDRAEAPYPATGLGRSLKNIAALIAGNLETRVYYASLGGFDTHANQLNNHARLLKDLSEAMAAFQTDLKRRKIADRVTTMTFSEFGRRPSENGTAGTDHGTAAPLFVMGSAIKNPLVGAAPSLKLERNRDLTHSTDFRQVYATLLRRSMHADPAKILGSTKFEELDFI